MIDQRKQRIKKIQRLRKLQTGSGRDLFEEAPEIDWIIPNRIPLGFSVCNYGPSQSRKTTLKLQEALAIASGTNSFFGKAEQLNVLWIDEEMGFTGLSMKIRQIANGMGLKPEQWIDTLYYKTMTDYKINTPEGREVIENYVLVKDVDVVYVDSLFSTMVKEGNMTAEDAGELRQTNKLCYKLGITIQTIAHVPKSHIGKNLQLSSIFSAVDFGNQIDVAYSFQDRGNNKIQIKQQKGRHTPPEMFYDNNAQVVGNDDAIFITDLGKTSDVVKNTKEAIQLTAETILGLKPEESSFMRTKEIEDTLKERHCWGETKVTNGLKLLEKNKQIKWHKSGPHHGEIEWL